MVTEEVEKKGLVFNYYKILFESHVGGQIEQLLQHVLVKVTKDMNQMLCREVSSEKIKTTLDAISDIKAPGADRMPALFYK